MDLKKFISGYLVFSRRDRIAILSLIFIICGIYFLPVLTRQEKSINRQLDSSIQVALKNHPEGPGKPESHKNSNRPYSTKRAGYSSYGNSSLFEFDPNTASAGEFKKLGFRDKTIGIIIRYRSKGGRFRTKEDLLKVYGLFPDEYDRFEPYIKIEHTTSAQKSDDTPVQPFNSIFKNQAVRKTYTSINVNTADTTQWSSLPGIGSKLSNRIVNFREKLGGFYSVTQVAETFGLPDSTFQKIKSFLLLNNSSVTQINVNTASIDELKSHPYIRYALAGAIINYRNEHGPFKSLEEIKNVMVITDDVYKKISPYLKINE